MEEGRRAGRRKGEGGSIREAGVQLPLVIISWVWDQKTREQETKVEKVNCQDMGR